MQIMIRGLVLAAILLTVAAPVTAVAGQTERATLKIDGVECRSCVKQIRKVVLDTPGVKSCTLKSTGNVVKDFFGLERPEWHAVIEYEKGTVTPEQLVKVVTSASDEQFTYHASVVKAGP